MIFSVTIKRIREYDSLVLILLATVALWTLTISANGQYDPTLTYVPGDPDMIGSVPVIDDYADGDITPKDVHSYWEVDTFCVSARVYNLECIEYTIDSTLIHVTESAGTARTTIFATDTDCDGEPDRWDNDPSSCEDAEDEDRLCMPLPKGSVIFKDERERDYKCLPAQTPKH